MASTQSSWITPAAGAQLRALGYTGNVRGNLFTYELAPQIKKHSGRYRPFGEALFGAGHTGTYGTIYNAIHGILAAGNSNNAFAMELGGGLDIPQPGQVTQNNFRYMLRLDIGFGGKS